MPALRRTWTFLSSTVVADGLAPVMLAAARGENSSRRRVMSLTAPWTSCNVSSLLSSSRSPPAGAQH